MEIAHGRFSGRDGNIVVTGTFGQPPHGHHSRHVNGTLYLSEIMRSRPFRLGFQAHPE
jgi:hypothetical protein